jgi:hypothetical protein
MKIKFNQFVNENYDNYRNNCYNLGVFLKNEFPTVYFHWDEDSKGWWTEDEDFLNKYSMERNDDYEYDTNKLKYKYSQLRRGKLIINSDFDKLQITLD